jgi:hypothetical protein
MEVSGVRLGLLRPSYAGPLRRRCSTPLMVTPHDRLEHRRGRIGLVLTGDSSDLDLRRLGWIVGGDWLRFILLGMLHVGLRGLEEGLDILVHP